MSPSCVTSILNTEIFYKGNTPEKSIIEYQMNVHSFGNGPSPAVASRVTDLKSQHPSTARRSLVKQPQGSSTVTSMWMTA